MAEEGARASTSRIASDYDAVAYVPQPEPMLDLERVFGLAAVYGHGAIEPAKADVLDIGCGVGVQLERLAAQTSGALAGTDISASACAAATQRLAPHGARATIRCADLLDLDASDLGQFDVIYCVGVIYVTPAQVKQRIFDLMGQCLRPGGVAVLSYYAGSMGALRAQLNRMIRAAVDPMLPPKAQVDQARAWLKHLAGQFPPSGAEYPAQIVRLVVDYSDDPTLFHEALCERMTSNDTGAIEAELAGRGLRFLSYLHPMPSCGLPTSAQRGAGADAFDFMYGGYRYAAFVKADGPEAPPSASLAPRLRGGLVRRSAAGDFHDPALGSIRTGMPLMQAALDELQLGPASSSAVAQAALARLARHGAAAPDNARAIVEDELHKLWQAGWLTPLA